VGEIPPEGLLNFLGMVAQLISKGWVIYSEEGYILTKAGNEEARRRFLEIPDETRVLLSIWMLAHENVKGGR
jgi:Mn-dependent DtxR family transcriptional regulator